MDYGYETNRKKLLKNIIPKSGSYDFKNVQPLTATTNNGTLRLKETHLIYNNSNKASNYINHYNNNKNNTNSINTTVKNSHNTINGNKLKTMPKRVQSKMPENKFDLNNSLFDKIFPKYKRSLIGIPLLCLAYFGAIYFVLSYGAISIISIYQLIIGDSNMYPLFLLVIGYIAITVMSLLLIIAIYKEILNFVACWIIVISVYILPEIGLNILLANNSLNWFQTNTGFYTLVILIVRICFNLPCIFFILVYHINLTKKNIYLKNLMMPLKDSIVNGDVLKIYNSIKIDNNSDVPAEVYQSMPAYLNQSNASSNDTTDLVRSQFNSNNNNNKASAVVTFSDKKLNEFNYKPNTYFYRFSPHKNYSIQLKPSHSFDDCDVSSHSNDLNALHLVWNKNNPNNFSNNNNNNKNQMTNFDYLRKMHQNNNNNYNQEFDSNQIFQIPIYADPSQHDRYSNKQVYRPIITTSDSFNSNNNNKSLGLSNHQIYLPPNTNINSTTPAYENSYIKIARSFQI